MAFCRLTLNWGDNGTPVWINPKNVIAFWPQAEGTSITTNGSNQNGPHAIYVRETPDIVANAIANAERE